MGCFYTSIIVSVAFKVTADGPSVKTQILNQCDSILHFFEPQRPWKSLMQLPGKVQSTWLSPLKYFLQRASLPHTLPYSMSFTFQESEELSWKSKHYCNRNDVLYRALLPTNKLDERPMVNPLHLQKTGQGWGLLPTGISFSPSPLLLNVVFWASVG